MNYSIGIPARNEENTISDSITSALNQTIPPLEVIVCINGSTDKTHEIANTLATKDDRIKVVESKPGVANAWNVITRNAIKKFIGFVDGDVHARPDAFGKLYTVLKNNPNLSAAGGSIVRHPPIKETLYTKFSDQEYGINTRTSSIHGGIYMINCGKLLQHAEQAGVNLLPSDTINTAQLISLIAKSCDGETMVHDAIIETSPMLYLKDLINMRLRISRGRKQIRERYPHLYNSSREATERLKGYIKRISQAKTTRKKTGALVFGVVREAIHQYTAHSPTPRDAHIWEPVENTKIPINK